MSTTTTTQSPAVITGMYARAVAKTTGLSERALENLHPDTFGARGHWTFISGGNGGMFYTPAGLAVLIEQLHAAGHVAESNSLARAARASIARGGGLVGLRPIKSSEPFPVEQVPAMIKRTEQEVARFNAGWAARWEAAQG